jgi:hypothetical protein
MTRKPSPKIILRSAASPSEARSPPFLEVEGIEVLAKVHASKTKVVMPLKTQFYGMREFTFEDPEGWIVTMAEPPNAPLDTPAHKGHRKLRRRLRLL